jgi:hypothetical protein
MMPHAAAQALLAATAGTLFEAAPFVVLAEFLPCRLRPLARAAGCGCAGRGSLPGALAPLAFAFCWISFGPAVALGRAVAAALLALAWRRRASLPFFGDATSGKPTEAPGQSGTGATGDPFADLARLAACAAVTAAFAGRVESAVTSESLRFVTGLVLGTLAPCATAGVAMAAGAAPHAPLLAAGLLATAGILSAPTLRLSPVPPPVPSSPGATGATTCARKGGARFAFLLLGLALELLCLRGASGLVNPRLVPLAGVGAAAALALALGRRSPRVSASAGLVPLIMLAALVSGSPPPVYAAGEATAAAGFAGEPIAFTGVAYGGTGASGGTRLVRFAIACCRLDARAVAVELEQRIDVRDGTWVALRGRFVARAGRLVVRPEHWQRVPAPQDPFVYF